MNEIVVFPSSWRFFHETPSWDVDSFTADGTALLFHVGDRFDTAGYGATPSDGEVLMLDIINKTLVKPAALNGYEHGNTILPGSLRSRSNSSLRGFAILQDCWHVDMQVRGSCGWPSASPLSHAIICFRTDGSSRQSVLPCPEIICSSSWAWTKTHACVHVSQAVVNAAHIAVELPAFTLRPYAKRMFVQAYQLPKLRELIRFAAMLVPWIALCIATKFAASRA